jgi:uncharacterized protein YegP (UPF0339 family)
MAGKFVLKNSRDGQFYFNLKAGNSQVILTSETYQEKRGALTGIESVKTNAPDDSRYERKKSGAQHYFILKAANGRTVGKSELYKAAASMENGIASVKKNGPTAEIKDETAES